jgi:hypothetical protein
VTELQFRARRLLKASQLNQAFARERALSEHDASTAAPVQSVAGRTGDVTLTAADSSFTQSGTGAAARTVENRLREVVSLKDFGAVGDNTTDDTAAIQAWLDYLAGLMGASGLGATGYVPPGQYLATRLYIRRPMYLLGAGSNICEFVQPITETQPFFNVRVAHNGYNWVNDGWPSGVLQIDGIRLRGRSRASGGTSRSAMDIAEADTNPVRHYVLLRDVQIYNFSGDGIYSSEVPVSGDRLHITYCGQDCLSLSNVADCHFTASNFGLALRDNIRLRDVGQTSFSSGCNSYTGGESCLDLYGQNSTGTVMFYDMMFDRSSKLGAKLNLTNGYRVLFDNCTFYLNGQAAANTYPDVQLVVGSSNAATFRSCVWGATYSQSPSNRFTSEHINIADATDTVSFDGLNHFHGGALVTNAPAQVVHPVWLPPGPYADDAAAATAGVAVGYLYRVTGGSVAWRVS